MSDPKQPSPQAQCGFHRPDKTVVTEADLRAAVVAATLAERTQWFAATTSTFEKEHDNARFGDLVRYWLAGRNSDIHPGKLESVQKAALDPAISYGNLANARLNAAIRAFTIAEATVNAKSADVYRASDVVDAAKTALDTAEKVLSTALTNARTAAARVRTVAAQQSSSGSGSGSNPQLAHAQADLTAAQTTLKTRTKDRDTAKAAHATAARALASARSDHARAVTARKPFAAPAQNWDPKDKEAVRKDLLASAGSSDPQKIDALIDTALQLAHQSRADIEAWSAVFVSSCVRTAAIGLTLETLTSGGSHQGKNRLLETSARHWEYVVKARKRKAESVRGSYHAFEPRERAVQLGDIIVTDRNEFIGRPTPLTSLASGILHGDIVTRIHRENGVPAFAEAIGGNVAHAVRRRRYPLTADGKLVVSATRLYAQEDDKGNFAAFTTRSRVPSMLEPASTGRIMALLSPVVECKTVPASTGTSTGGRTGQELELESPFADEVVLVTPSGHELEPALARLAAESPFGLAYAAERERRAIGIPAA